jgi:hypothetical protein
MRRVLVPLLLLAAAGCRVTTTERIAAPEAVHVERGAAARSWNVLADDLVIGHVVLFEAPDRPEAPVFMVQNEVGQDLGLVDGLGRAWRYHPHQRDAEWLGTGTVAEGAARILGAGACQLAEVQLSLAREAAQTR